jgi:hypothetical protein
VLEAPDVVTWSRAKPGNKQFDKLLSLKVGAYGRVILEPEPTPEDIAAGKVTNFVFVSWHPVGAGQFRAAKLAAEHPHVNPLQTRKALPFGRALQPLSTIRLPDSSRGAMAKSAGPQGASLGLVGASPQAAPDLEGVPFDWTARFRDSHHRKAEASDWQTGCTAEYSVRAGARVSSKPAIVSGVEIVALSNEAASIVAGPCPVRACSILGFGGLTRGGAWRLWRL